MRSVSGIELISFVETLEETCKLSGNFDNKIDGFCALNHPKSRCILWVKHPENTDLSSLEGLSDLVIVTPLIIDLKSAKNTRCIITMEPKSVFFSILKQFWKNPQNCEIATTAITKGATIYQNVSIGHHCYISPGAVIGAGTIIEHNVSIINRVEIGENCLIHSGVAIGTDGFGFFVNHEGVPCKVEHFGGVRIGNNVEIGANTCIDRGTIGDTWIQDNCKIDNLVHIAHNVVIEKNSMLTAQSLVAGSAHLKEGSYTAPGAIIKNQLTIGKNAFIGMGAVVIKDVEQDTVVAGVPAVSLRKVNNTDK